MKRPENKLVPVWSEPPEEHMALVPIPIQSIPNDVSLPFPLYLQISERPILFRNTGDRLTSRRIASLLEKGVTVIYLPDNAWKRYLQLLESKTREREERGTLEAETNAEIMVSRVRNLLLAYSQDLERTQKVARSHLVRLWELGKKMASLIAREPHVSRKFLRRYPVPALYFVNHCVNVAVYSAMMGRQLNILGRDAKLLTYSALIHNIGNLYVPREILYKPGPLTDSEWRLVQEHPHRGGKLLETLSAPHEVIATAHEHHERSDGQGYPNGRFASHIHVFSKITAIADVFDALTTVSPYRSAIDYPSAIHRMLEMPGKFEPSLIRLLNSVTTFQSWRGTPLF